MRSSRKQMRIRVSTKPEWIGALITNKARRAAEKELSKALSARVYYGNHCSMPENFEQFERALTATQNEPLEQQHKKLEEMAEAAAEKAMANKHSLKGALQIEYLF